MSEVELLASLEQELSRAVEWQRKRLLQEGRRRIPHLTPEDILQPNDFPELEHDPEFRYEEGILAGMLSLQMTFQSFRAIPVALLPGKTDPEGRAFPSA